MERIKGLEAVHYDDHRKNKAATDWVSNVWQSEGKGSWYLQHLKCTPDFSVGSSTQCEWLSKDICFDVCFILSLHVCGGLHLIASGARRPCELGCGVNNAVLNFSSALSGPGHTQVLEMLGRNGIKMHNIQSINCGEQPRMSDKCFQTCNPHWAIYGRLSLYYYVGGVVGRGGFPGVMSRHVMWRHNKL